jgi:hypothetical protein
LAVARHGTKVHNGGNVRRPTARWPLGVASPPLARRNVRQDGPVLVIIGGLPAPGCVRHANVFTWTLASLASGASAKFAITVKATGAGKALVLAAAASQNLDPRPLNNISLQQVTITR